MCSFFTIKREEKKIEMKRRDETEKAAREVKKEKEKSTATLTTSKL